MLLAFEGFQPPLDTVGLLFRLLRVTPQGIGEFRHCVRQLLHLAVEPKQHERRHRDRKPEIANQPDKRVFHPSAPPFNTQRSGESPLPPASSSAPGSPCSTPPRRRARTSTQRRYPRQHSCCS